MTSKYNSSQPKVAIIMGSESDMPVMVLAIMFLMANEIPFEVKVVSAHRTPDFMAQYAKEAKGRGIKVIIAGAGGSAHLPGMVASYTTLPVIGIPIRSKDSTAPDATSQLSISEMPAGIAVATMAVNGSKNGALLAMQILALSNRTIDAKLNKHKPSLVKSVEKMNTDLGETISKAIAAEEAKNKK